MFAMHTAELLEMSRKAAEEIKFLSGLNAVEVGSTPKSAVYHSDHITLYHYQAAQPDPNPILICYALVNRPYMVDLQADRSLVGHLLELGKEVYLIDWGYPKRNDRWLSLEDYILGYLNECVDFLLKKHAKVNLLGICQGGALSLCYAALHPEKIRNLITMVTPVDFHVPGGLLNAWMGSASSFDPALMVDAMGNIPGDLMNFGFLMLKPFELGLQKYLGLLDMNREQAANFLRMEKWIFDSPDQAGEAWLEFVRDFYIQNKLVQGTLEIGGQSVLLENISMPVLNIYAENDHLVPPASSQALAQHIASSDYQSASFPVGHIGMYVSSKVQKQLAPIVANWLAARA